MSRSLFAPCHASYYLYLQASDAVQSSESSSSEQGLFPFTTTRRGRWQGVRVALQLVDEEAFYRVVIAVISSRDRSMATTHEMRAVRANGFEDTAQIMCLVRSPMDSLGSHVGLSHSRVGIYP